MKLLPAALAVLVTGCGLVQVKTNLTSGGGGPVQRGSGSTLGAARGGTGGAGSAGGGVESEDALGARWCATLEERLAEPARRLAAARSETDPRKALAIHGQVYRDAGKIKTDVQREFDADYIRIGKITEKNGTAGTPGVGYNSINNGQYFQHSEVELEAVAGGTALMAKHGLPFAVSDENGIRASEVNFLGASTCRSQRRTTLHHQIAENVKNLPKAFSVSGWGREEDMPAKAGDLVEIEGGLVSVGANPTIRLAGGRPVYKNCRTTNRFSHFDANGYARYQEECQYAGGREVVVLATIKGIGPFLPPEASALKVGDYVKVRAHAISVSKKVTTAGDLTTTTHTVELTPVAVQQVARDRKALFTF